MESVAGGECDGAGGDPLAPFSAPVRRWFEDSFEAPTAAQAGGWEAISRGENALICAPTGSGKTLAAFLWGIDRLSRDSKAGTDADLPDASAPPDASAKSAAKRDKRRTRAGADGGDGGAFAKSGATRDKGRTPRGAGVRIVYVSPLKALSYDIERNLRAPLRGIGADISVGLRTGDTSQAERRAMRKSPPDILITTPSPST